MPSNAETVYGGDGASPDADIDVIRLITEDRRPSIAAGRIGDARAEPNVRGERILSRLEAPFLHANRWMRAVVPEALNPFAQLGAVANTTFLIALASGILLLFWYVPSVEKAYASVLRMEASPYLAGLIRSLHRYSSDACMLFVLLHALQALGARKVGPARRLPWIAGLVMVGVIWLDGWTGYWLVWDEAARQVALATAAFLDVLPIFPEPLARSFLVDDGVNSLLFFVVFFIHMLIPLALGVSLWVHVLRLNKAHILAGRGLTAAMMAALVAVSLLFPAEAGGPARMAVAPEGIAIDGFYLLPLYLAERLEGGLLWTIFLTVTIAAIGLPWLIARRRPTPAVVDAQRCNGCTLCYEDCPFDAISLVTNPDGRYPMIAEVDPLKCVGCSICVGACDSNAIDQPRLPVRDVRRWLNESPQEGAEFTAFVCANSGAAEFRLDDAGACAELPGYRVVPVPCAGWVHMLMIERALRRGTRGVLLVGCGPDPSCRIGERWTSQRLRGDRAPARRFDKVRDDQVRHVSFNRIETAALLRAAVVFREESGRCNTRRGVPAAARDDGFTVRKRLRAAIAAAAMLMVVIGLVVPATRLPFTSAGASRSELVVSFKHAGALVEQTPGASRDQSELLPHMQSEMYTERVRGSVRLYVSVDGEERIDRRYPPGGLFGDGSSIALERLEIPSGNHTIEVRLADSEDLRHWTWKMVQEVEFRAGERRVVLFEAPEGFAIR